MLSRLQVVRAWRSGSPVPGAGTLAVFQQQMRRRQPWLDLLWMALLVLLQAGVAIALQSRLMPLREYTTDAPRFLTRMLAMQALIAPLIYLPAAAVIGALAAPPAARFEETQSMLLTRLTSFDVCAGRLAACLWPVMSAILASFALTLTAQIIWRPVLSGAAAGYGALLMAHLVLLTSTFAVGAIGFLAAMRSRPGRIWARGAIAALAVALLAVGGPIWIDPAIRRLDDPTGIINTALLADPATAASAALGMDALRLPWVYDRTGAPEYPFSYPPAAASCALFAAVAAGALAACAARLRRSYR